MVRTCPKCRRELLERSKFCPNCGTGVAAITGVTSAVTAPVRTPAEVAAVPRPRADAAGTAPMDGRAGGLGRTVAGDPRLAQEPAGFALRFGALLFDLLVSMIAWMAFTFVLSYLSKKSVVSSNSMLATAYVAALGMFVLNFIVLAAKTGQTLGKRIIGIQIVRENGQPFGFGGAFLRHVAGYGVSAAGAFLGFAWILWDRRQQGWHDKLAHTIVVLIK